MAEVWLARFNGVGGFQKQVVLKTILPHLSEDPEFVRMFINEALLAARLNHPNIVQIFDLGRLEGRYFIAMEHVPGRSFRQISRRRREQGELIPAWFILRVMAAVCDGLYYAHEYCDEQGNPLGLVHRDVSPENIMISFTGIAKILDFGVAKATTAATVTKAGTLKGKYSYISPEQVKGAPADRRSDVYALGVILYEFLTGIRPFRGNNDLALLREIAKGNPTAPQKIAPWIKDELQEIILTALMIDPDERYSDTGKLALDILEFLRKSGDQISQRDMGLYVSSLFPDEPSIPSDVQKRLFSVQTIETEKSPAAMEDPPEAMIDTSENDSGTIEITGLDSWEGDDIPPVDFREVKREADDSQRKEKQAARADRGATAPSPAHKKESRPTSSLPHFQASTTQRGQAAPPSGSASTPPRAAQQGRKPSQEIGPSDPRKAKARPAPHAADTASPGPKPKGEQGKGSWLQRIIRKDPKDSAKAPKDDSSTRQTAKHRTIKDEPSLDSDTSISLPQNVEDSHARVPKKQVGQGKQVQPPDARNAAPPKASTSADRSKQTKEPAAQPAAAPASSSKGPSDQARAVPRSTRTMSSAIPTSQTGGTKSGALPTSQTGGTKSGALPTSQTRGTKSGALPTPKSTGTKSGALPTPKSTGTKSAALPTPKSTVTKSGALPTSQTRGTKSGALPTPQSTGTKSGALPTSQTRGTKSGALPTPQSTGTKSGALPTPQSTGTKSGALPTPKSTGTKSGALPTPKSTGTKSGALPKPKSTGTKSGALPKPKSTGTKSGALPTPKSAESKQSQGPSTTKVDQPPQRSKTSQREDQSKDEMHHDGGGAKIQTPPGDEVETDQKSKQTSDIFGVQRPSFSKYDDESDIFTSHSGVTRSGNVFDQKNENTPSDPRSIFDRESEPSRGGQASVFDRESKSIFDKPAEPAYPESSFSFSKPPEENSQGFSKNTEDDFINRFREMGRQARSRATQSIAVPPEADDWSLRRESPLPSNPAAEHFEKGLASLQQGNYDSALTEWEAAIGYDPDNRLYQTNLQRLRDLLAAKNS